MDTLSLFLSVISALCLVYFAEWRPMTVSIIFNLSVGKDLVPIPLVVGGVGNSAEEELDRHKPDRE